MNALLVRRALLVLAALAWFACLAGAETFCHCDCCLSSYSDHRCEENLTRFQVQTCTSCSLFECLQRYPICVQNFKGGVVPRCLDEEAVLTQIVFWTFIVSMAVLLSLSVLRFFSRRVDRCVRSGETAAANSRRREHSKIKKERLRRVLQNEGFDRI